MPGSDQKQRGGLLARNREAYLDLLRDAVIGALYRDPPLRSDAGYNQELRDKGLDWPSIAHSMIGRARMNNVREVIEIILRDKVPGDFIETGVWRGGTCIFMRGILHSHGVNNRRVWLADSFQGLPKPDELNYPADAGDEFHTYRELVVSLDEVRANFARYGLLDDRVKFLPGWFRDTLPRAPMKRLALLRLDGDMYESTIQALDALYPKLSPGGFVIVDDFHVVPACRRAIEDFRERRGIEDALVEIDGVGVYWRRAMAPRAESG